MKAFEERFTGWVDGELSGRELAEFEKELAAEYPAAKGDRAAALKLGQLLRQHPTAPSLANADFFNLQIEQQLARETRPPAIPKAREVSFWSLSRLAWAGAGCLVIAAALFQSLIPVGTPAIEASDYFAQVVETWPFDPTISATTVYDPRDNVTVVWLEGLDYLPTAGTLR